MNDPLLAFLAGGKDPSHVENLNAEFASRLNAMIAAAPGGVTINSGYRSPERQAELWAEALQKYGSPEAARKWVAPPGKSQHNHGGAADLGYASPEVEKWVHDNAANFGLNFRMGYEPWHIEMSGGQPVMVADGAPVPAQGGPAPAPASMPEMLAASFSRPQADPASAPASAQAVPAGTGNIQGQSAATLAALLDELQTASMRPITNRTLPQLLG